MIKKLYLTQIVVLLAGSLFAWYTVVTDFMRFYGYEGTLFRIKNCVVPNPVTTPCFYGAFAFVLALVWSIAIYRMQYPARFTHQKRLRWLLVASVLFAWTNFTITLVGYFQAKAAGKPFLACAGVAASSPFVTPCFIGAVIFLAAFLVSVSFTEKPGREGQSQS